VRERTGACDVVEAACIVPRSGVGDVLARNERNRDPPLPHAQHLAARQTLQDRERVETSLLTRYWSESTSSS